VPDPQRQSSDPSAWQPPKDALFGFDGTGAPPVSLPFPGRYPPPYPEPVYPESVDPEPTGSGPTSIAGSLYAASDGYRDNATYGGNATYRPGDTYRPGMPPPAAAPPAWAPPVRRDRVLRRSRARRVVPFIIAAVFLGRFGIAIAGDEFDGSGRPTLAPMIVD
jgi:hypothetical protein